MKRRGMIISVKHEALKNILKDAREKQVGISIRKRSGEWSSEYSQIDEVKDVHTHNGTMTVIILLPSNDSNVRLLDLQLVAGVRFSEGLMVTGRLTDEINVESEAWIPHHVFEYF